MDLSNVQARDDVDASARGRVAKNARLSSERATGDALANQNVIETRTRDHALSTCAKPYAYETTLAVEDVLHGQPLC